MRSRVLGAALVTLGLAQMLGDLLHLDLLKGLAAATAASPAPKVFSAVGKLETYSVRFDIEWIDDAGKHTRALDSALYETMEGPYNRRNIYGAVLAFGPVLSTNPRTQPMFESVFRAATCHGAPLLRELGLSQRARDVRVIVTPLPGVELGDLPRVLAASCP